LPGEGDAPPDLAEPGETLPALEPSPGAPSPAASATDEQRVARAIAHAERLRQRPGDPEVCAYPASVLPTGDAGLALTPGPKPAVVLFYDDGSRASSLQAARALPVLARHAERLDVVAVDRAAGAPETSGARALAERYLRYVPGTVVLDPSREVVLLRSGAVEADELEAAILRALGEGPAEPALAPSASPPPPIAGLGDPDAAPASPPTSGASTAPSSGPSWLPGAAPPPSHSAPAPEGTGSWLPGSDAPAAPPAAAPALPAPASDDPWTSSPGAERPPAPGPEARPPTEDPDLLPPAGTGEPPQPEPVPLPDPGTAPAEPGRSEPAFSPPAEERPAPEPRDPDVEFTPPPGYGAEAHAERLLKEAGNPALPGYPEAMIPRTSATKVGEPGHKPLVLIFHDDASKASDLQAAEFLGVLLRRRDEVDLVLVDVNPKARWSEDEKRVVRTYYNFYVPTTVVLTARRAPVKLWYVRVTAKDLDRAITQALEAR
jgi:hypothetical protein